MQLQLTIAGVDYTERAFNVAPSWGLHGDDILTADIELTLSEAYALYLSAGLPEVSLNDGDDQVWKGVLVGVTLLTGFGVRIEAMGKWVHFTHGPYTSLWSATGYAEWEPVTGDDHSDYNESIFEIDNNNRLYITPIENQTFTSVTDKGGLVFKMPHNGARQLKAIQFTYEMTSASGWDAVLIGYNEGFTSAATLWTLSGGFGTQTGAAVVQLSTAKDYIVLALYRPSSSTTPTADIGTLYIKLTNVRITTTVTNMVNTTLGTTIAAGTRTVTPGSMNNIYVGQALIIGGSSTERVLVTAVTATTFTAVFANGHNSADTVEALYVAADEIAGELVSAVNDLNAGSLKSSQALVQDPGLDLLDELYEDLLPADILGQLAELGDGSAAWDVGVVDGALYFRPERDEARTWYTDEAVTDMERSMLDLFNSAYGVYRDQRGRVLRTDVQTDTWSPEIHGLTRRKDVDASTTSETQADSAVTAALAKTANPEPRLALAVGEISAAGGAFIPARPWELRRGDVLIQRDLPPELTTSPDAVSAIGIARVGYKVDTDELFIEPLEAPASLERVVKKLATDLVTATRRPKPDKVRVI